MLPGVVQASSPARPRDLQPAECEESAPGGESRLRGEARMSGRVCPGSGLSARDLSFELPTAAPEVEWCRVSCDMKRKQVLGLGLSLLVTGLFFLSVASARQERAAAGFDGYFTGRTLRFDYYHSGTATQERLSEDSIRLEGLWPGSRTQLVDSTNLGKYLFEVVDPVDGRTIYSRGFASIYGEWETTGEARQEIWRTFQESQRFPEPTKPVRLAFSKRGRDGHFVPLASFDVDPAGRFVDRSEIRPQGRLWAVMRNGEPATKADLLVLGDGYTEGEADKFHSDTERLVGALFDTEPFRSRRRDFNVWAIDLPSAQSGISDPRRGVWRDSPLGLSFNAFDTDRYVLTYANRRLRDIAAQAPYDFLVILFNDRKYGGGGIFNLWATCAADTKPASYVFVHELGHSIGGLGDEYYSSQVAYEDFTPVDVEPWEPNITALLDPKRLKWADLVAPSTPIPTPWDQAAYDRIASSYDRKRSGLRDEQASDSQMERLFDEVAAATGPLLRKEPYFGKVGAFEGAGYRPQGLYRPAVDCIMFTRNPKSFCSVCRRAIERIIDLYAH